MKTSWKQTPRMNRHRLGRLEMICALPLLLAGCDAAREETADEPASPAPAGAALTGSMSVTLTAAQIANGKIAWAPVTLAATSVSVEVTGQLLVNDDRTARVSSPAQARAVTVHVSPGDRVARGARLVTLVSPEASTARSDVAKAQAEVSSRRAAAQYARSARDRAERLLNLKAIPRQDYERALADDELARASLSQAQSELVRARAGAQQLGLDPGSGAMVIRSPVAGVVTSRDVAPGTVVEAGAPLITVTDPGSLWLNVALPERLATGVRVGSTLRFTVAPYPRDTFPARVQSVSASYDPTTRSLPVRGLVVNSGGRLRPEMFARVWVESGAGEMFPVVPDEAIQRINGKPVVFVVQPQPNGAARFEMREIETRSTTGGRATISGGVRQGEIVVVQGAYAVKAELEKGRMSEMDM